MYNISHGEVTAFEHRNAKKNHPPDQRKTTITKQNNKPNQPTHTPAEDKFPASETR